MELDPMLQLYLDYMDFIRKDKVGYEQDIFDGNVFKKLYDDNSIFLEGKIISAQRPGIHAEILVVNELIKTMRKNGITINSLQNLVNKGVKVIVKGKSFGHMPTCPHCHNILQKLNIVFNE